MQEIDAAFTINAVKDVPFSYPYCVICVRKIQPRENKRWSCAYCGNWQRENQVQHRFRMVYSVTDCHRLANVTVFGKSLEKLFGETADQFNKYIAGLESLLFAKGVSIKQVLLYAVQHVFCGSTFCFTFSVPLKHTKSPAQVNLNWLEKEIPGELIAKRISFPTFNGEGHPTVKEAMYFFVEKMSLQLNLINGESHLCEASYFLNSNCKDMKMEKSLCTKPLNSNVFCESVAFCSPGMADLGISLSKSEYKRKCGTVDICASPYEAYLQFSSCLPRIDNGSIMLSSTPLPAYVYSKNAVSKNPHSMAEASRCYDSSYKNAINSEFEETNCAKIGKIFKVGIRKHRKCSKELLRFYQTDNDKNQSQSVDSDCMLLSSNTIDDNSSQKNFFSFKSACTSLHSKKSTESKLICDHRHTCSGVSDSELSPDIFK